MGIHDDILVLLRVVHRPKPRKNKDLIDSGVASPTI